MATYVAAVVWSGGKYRVVPDRPDLSNPVLFLDRALARQYADECNAEVEAERVAARAARARRRAS